MKKSEIIQIIGEEIDTVLIPESADQSHRLTERLARGLKPLLTMGSKITKKVGEDALVKLSDKFDRIDDEVADDIASHLNMAIELMQDGYPGDATKKLKQFNKACKDVLKGKSVGSAFEGVNEASAKDKFNAPPMNKWWTGNKDALMSAIYHAQRQVPPSNKAAYEKNWQNIVKQLQKKFPAPTAIYKAKLNEAKLKKGDAIQMDDGEYGVVNKVKGKVAYIKLDSMPGSFHPIEADRTTYKGKHKGKDLYLEAFNPKATQQFWNQKMIKAKTMKDVKKLYPKAKKTSEVHGAVFYIELEKDLYAKAFSKNTMKSIEPFTVEAIYSMKGKKQTFLYKEGKLNEAISPKKAAEVLFDKLAASKLIGKQNRKRAVGVIEYMLSRMNFNESVNEATDLWKKFDEKQRLYSDGMDIENDLKNITATIKQLHKNMEQEAEPEGGKIADKYGKQIEKYEKMYKKRKSELEKVFAKIDKLEQY
jgi:hypothetical protein